MLAESHRRGRLNKELNATFFYTHSKNSKSCGAEGLSSYQFSGLCLQVVIKDLGGQVENSVTIHH